MVRTTEYEYSIFVSYTDDDDRCHSRWITNFCRELRDVLQARLRKTFRPFCRYTDYAVASGDLSERLRDNVRRSATMLIFVHEHYVLSETCRKELELFKEIFGEDGFRKRLFIVAMSRRAITELVGSDHWKAVVPLKDQVWATFYRRDNDHLPLHMYGSRDIVDRDFQEALLPLVDDLERSLRVPAPLPPPRPPTKQRWILGAVRPELEPEVQDLASGLRSVQRDVETLGVHDLHGALTQLDAADVLVLPFNDGEPLMSFIPGGHLALQHDAWLGAGKPADAIRWLDLRATAAPVAAKPVHAERLRSLARPVVAKRDLAPGIRSVPDPDRAWIYIESNRREVDHWHPLGERMQVRWSVIAQGEAPPMFDLRSRGLPVDDLAQFPTIADADGFVLLWGRKEPSSLVAQIRSVEGRIPGSDPPPGIVAYLIPPQHDDGEPVPAWSWKVLRFNAQSPDDIDVVTDDADRLDHFLRQILKRVRHRRRALAAAS